MSCVSTICTVNTHMTEIIIHQTDATGSCELSSCARWIYGVTALRSGGTGGKPRKDCVDMGKARMYEGQVMQEAGRDR